MTHLKNLIQQFVANVHLLPSDIYNILNKNKNSILVINIDIPMCAPMQGKIIYTENYFISIYSHFEKILMSVFCFHITSVNYKEQEEIQAYNAQKHYSRHTSVKSKQKRQSTNVISKQKKNLASHKSSAANNSKKRTKQKSSSKAKNQQTSKQDLSIEEQGNYVAIDCEFVGVGIGGAHSALARVSIVDWESNVLLDTFVQVSQPVTDYRTFVSGITQEDIQGDNSMAPEQCIALVKRILHNKIVIGHGLKSDFAALDLHHPWELVRDTAKYEPFFKKTKPTSMDGTNNYYSNLPKPRKLKDLAMTKLNREIQKEGQAHCSIEDAVAAMDLYKKARTKWEAVMTYKIAKTAEMQNMLEYETP